MSLTTIRQSSFYRLLSDEGDHDYHRISTPGQTLPPSTVADLFRRAQTDVANIYRPVSREYLSGQHPEILAEIATLEAEAEATTDPVEVTRLLGEWVKSWRYGCELFRLSHARADPTDIMVIPSRQRRLHCDGCIRHLRGWCVDRKAGTCRNVSVMTDCPLGRDLESLKQGSLLERF